MKLWYFLIIWTNNNIYYISVDAKYSINNSNEYILINCGNNINKGIPIDYQSINFLLYQHGIFSVLNFLSWVL